MIELVIKAVRSGRIRYLIAGAWNTLFGYSLGVGLYLWLSDRLHVVAIGVVANILSISMSFVTYKVFVFRTHGRWLSEYFRSYVVYGSTAIVGVILLWVMVDGLKVPIWLAQGAIVVVTVAVSYVGHSCFTFKKPLAPKG